MSREREEYWDTINGTWKDDYERNTVEEAPIIESIPHIEECLRHELHSPDSPPNHLEGTTTIWKAIVDLLCDDREAVATLMAHEWRIRTRINSKLTELVDEKS